MTEQKQNMDQQNKIDFSSASARVNPGITYINLATASLRRVTRVMPRGFQMKCMYEFQFNKKFECFWVYMKN